MYTNKIENIIVKYLNNEATLTELEELTSWLDNSNNLKIFNDFVSVNYAINYNMKAYNSQLTKVHLLNVINKDKTERGLAKRKSVFLKYAALILIFFAIGYGYMQFFSVEKDTLVLPVENITLELDNGKTKTIIENESTNLVDTDGNIIGVQSGERIEYLAKEKSEVLVYNTLKVPYGRKFEVQLSDGTSVNLNAGSSLKYPIHFIKGKSRQVFLNGEAFFKVEKDKEHPFIVNTNKINVRVLGTEFNISSYPEDKNINTVLVEGAVNVYETSEIYNKDEAVLLKPGYKANWDKEKNAFEVSQTNVETHLAWINGKLILQEVAFKAILKKLERQYNVKFINHNKALENRIFTAKFDNEDIIQVMESLSYSGNFTYQFNENNIIINSNKK